MELYKASENEGFLLQFHILNFLNKLYGSFFLMIIYTVVMTLNIIFKYNKKDRKINFLIIAIYFILSTIFHAFIFLLKLNSIVYQYFEWVVYAYIPLSMWPSFELIKKQKHIDKSIRQV
jgi:hypothetical protein